MFSPFVFSFSSLSHHQNTVTDHTTVCSKPSGPQSPALLTCFSDQHLPGLQAQPLSGLHPLAFLPGLLFQGLCVTDFLFCRIPSPNASTACSVTPAYSCVVQVGDSPLPFHLKITTPSHTPYPCLSLFSEAQSIYPVLCMVGLLADSLFPICLTVHASTLQSILLP